MSLTINHRQEALEAVYRDIFAERIEKRGATAHANANRNGASAVSLGDAQLLERARAAKNGDLFAALYDRGDSSGQGFPSQSEADLALCSMLAFWCGRDAGRIDALFRGSALYREKWDRADYRERTLDEAIAGCTSDYDPNHNSRASGAQRNGQDAGANDDPFADLPTEPPKKKKTSKAKSTKDEPWNAARVDALIKKRFNYHAAQDRGGHLHIYLSGVYDHRGAEIVREWAKAVIPDDKWSTKLVNETIEHIRVGSVRQWDRPSPYILNVRNGLLNVHTRKLTPHSPAHLSTVQLPIVFDENATCPALQLQLEQTLSPDTVAAGVVWQMLAWFMVAHTAIQKAVLLLGEGGTGKSTLINVIVAFLGGHSNVSGMSLQKLESSRFATAQLLGKLLNACPDLPSTHLESSNVFKALTGTERFIDVERKFENGWHAEIYAALLFSANQPPISKDATDAFFQRWIVLSMNTVYRGTDKEVNRAELDAKLTTASELSGALNKALDALPAVLKSGITQTASMKQSAEDFWRETNPLGAWLSINTIDNPNMIIGVSEVVTKYNADALADERATLNTTAFGLAMKRLRPHVRRKQELYHGNPKAWVYRGIGWAARESDNARESAGAPYETTAELICRNCGVKNPADLVKCFACDEGLDGEAAL